MKNISCPIPTKLLVTVALLSFISSTSSNPIPSQPVSESERHNRETDEEAPIEQQLASKRIIRTPCQAGERYTNGRLENTTKDPEVVQKNDDDIAPWERDDDEKYQGRFFGVGVGDVVRGGFELAKYGVQVAKGYADGLGLTIDENGNINAPCPNSWEGPHKKFEHENIAQNALRNTFDLVHTVLDTVQGVVVGKA